MSLRSSRSAAEAAQRQHPRLRAFHDAMATAMQAFEKAREWPDLIKCLGRVNKVLSKFSHIEHVPMALTVSKRLAQCLNPVLPGGVHLKTLETYRVILERIGPKRLLQDLSLYSTGLFPLFSYASTRVKPDLLEIYENYYIKLGQGLLPCLSGFILAVLPGLEEGSGDVYARTLKLLEETRQQVSGPLFALALWRCLLQCPTARASALRFIVATIPPTGTPELERYLPLKRSLAIEAIVAALHDRDVLVQRVMFDLLISHFPLVVSVFTRNELIYLVQATLPVILRRETSVNRRLYSWLLGKGVDQDAGAGGAGISELTDDTLDMLVKSLIKTMIDPQTCSEDAAQSFNIARTLMEREEIQMSSFLSRISIPLIGYAYQYNCHDSEHSGSNATISQAVLKSAQLFFNQVDLDRIWASLTSALTAAFGNMNLDEKKRSVLIESDDDDENHRLLADETHARNRVYTINLIDFALDFLPMHFDNDDSGPNIIPNLIDATLKGLYNTSWDSAIEEFTRTVLFVTKLLSAKFAPYHGNAVLAEWDSFLVSVSLPRADNITDMFRSSVILCSPLPPTSSLEKALRSNDAPAAAPQAYLSAITLLFDLFHTLLLRGLKCDQHFRHASRYCHYVLEFALSQQPELACIGVEAWVRLVNVGVFEKQQVACINVAQHLWGLIGSKVSTDIHSRVALLLSHLYGLCPQLCEAVVANAMLHPVHSEDVDDSYEGYRRYSATLVPKLLLNRFSIPYFVTI